MPPLSTASDDVRKLNPSWNGKGRAAPKYGNRRTVVDGVTLDSRAEARRYQELRLEAQAGAITDLHVHPRYDLVVNGWRVGRYVADFDYRREGRLVVEDVKGCRTEAYRLKRALMRALFNIEIVEIKP